MTVDQSLEQILKNTFTKGDTYKRIVLLRDFLEHLDQGFGTQGYDWAGSLLAKYKDTPDADTAVSVAAWGNDVISLYTADSASQNVSDLRVRMMKLPELIIYAPVIPSANDIIALGTWCRANVDPKVLLELHVDSAAVGGCFFVWKDLYYDFSLTHLLQERQKEISALIERYAAIPASAREVTPVH